MTLTKPWSNIRTAHRLILLDICAILFVNPRGSRDSEIQSGHGSVTDIQTDGRPAGRERTGQNKTRQTKKLKKIYLPIL